MTPNIEGIVVPVLTPFTPGKDELDIPALKRLVDWLVGTGVSALIANAGTSEFYHLDDAERLQEAEIVVDCVAGRLPVLVGAGAVATRHSVRWAKHAESVGASGLLVMPPYYEAVSETAIQHHYAAISDAVSIPIMLYNTPFASQVLLSPEQICRIVSQANIPWVKQTTRVIDHTPLILGLLGNRVSIFEGWDTLAFASMANGAVGWVAGPANAIPELAVELWRLVRVERNLESAWALHLKLLPLLSFVQYEGVYCSALKEICRLRGYPLGTVRSPWEELTDEQRSRVKQIVVDLNLVGG